MSDSWHDINDPGFFVKPKSDAPEKKGAADDEDSNRKEKAGAIATLSDAKFVVPDKGVAFNEKCPARVSVSYKETTSQTRVTFKLFCTYKGNRQDLKHKADANESDGTAGTQLTLFYPDDYQDGQVDYFFSAEHTRGDKAVESAKLTLPLARKVTLVLHIETGAGGAALDDDTFTLYSTDSSKTYSQKKTVKNDKKAGENSFDLEFSDVHTDLKYSLETDPSGKGEKYLVFEDFSFSGSAK
jgi:hypothetical protein